tara:strand:- start:811 stop:2922 length:2112 start_codon:yes stop_codon:yes gene_type:complete
MAEFTETINIDMAKYLYTLDKNQYKEFLNKEDMAGTYQLIKTYLTKMINNKFSTVVQYKYITGKTFGRKFAVRGIQNLPKIIRGALLNGKATDIDLVNAHPNILHYICIKHKIQCPNLFYYINNRNTILCSMVEEIGVSKDQAKEEFIKSINDCKCIRTSFQFLKDYDREMKKIQQKLMEITEYSFIHPYTDKKERNIPGSFINNVMCYYEDLIIQDTTDYITSRNIEILGLFFDGLMIYGEPPPNLLSELNEVIKTKWEYDFKYVYKEHDTSLTIPQDFIFKEIPKNYENVKNEFNKFIAKVGGQYVNTITNQVYKVTELKDTYLHMGYTNNEGERKVFINSWVQNITDDMTIYDAFCVHPKKTLPNMYNLWTPFKYQNCTSEYIQNFNGLNHVLNHLLILCNNDDIVYKFMLMWFAQMFQYPENKSICPIFKSGEGTGKNTLLEFIGAVLGDGKLLETAKPDKDVWGDFNGRMKDAFLVHLSEIDYKKCNDKSSMYSLITDATLMINEKGKNQYTVDSFHRFIGSTNSDAPIYDKAGGRRFLLIQCSDEKKGDAEYFKTLRRYTEDPEVQRTFYDYIMNYECKPNIGEKDIPETEFHNQVREASRDTIELFIEDLIMNNFNEVSFKKSSAELWDEYRCFCDHNNLGCNMSKISFTSKIGHKKITGLSNLGKIWYKKKADRVYEFVVSDIKQRFGIAELMDI